MSQRAASVVESSIHAHSRSVRDRIIGALLVFFAAVIYFAFTTASTPSTISTFIMAPGGATRGVMDDLALPSRAILIGITVVLALLGLWLLTFGSKGRSNAFLVAGGVGLILAFLVYVSFDKRLNFASLFNSALTMSVPIALGALSGILRSEEHTSEL